MRLSSMFRPALAITCLLLSSAALAQTAPATSATTETLPPAEIRTPKPPVAPSLPKAALPDSGAHPDGRAAGGYDSHGDAALLRGLLGQQAAQHPVQPVQPGNGAFGAIQEVLAILEADPKTDWGRVNLDALRAHLIDMNEVMLNAEAKVVPVSGGIRITVTGKGRTLEAIHRMVPAHAREIDGHDGWQVAAEDQPDGDVLTVTTKDARQTAKIRALGFSGVLATGVHHPLHHLAIARGEAMVHQAGPHPAGMHPAGMQQKGN